MSGRANIVQRRIVILSLVCILAFALVGVRLIDVTLLRPTAAAPVPAGIHVVASRADIVDRNGELLARDLPVKDLYVASRARIRARHARA